MRRSFEDLQQRFTQREVRGISDADADGYLYAYVHSDEWKIGMTNDFSRRRDEWDRDCPDEWRIWLPPIRVANWRRSGQRTHNEIFVFAGPWPVVWSTIVYPILLRAAIA
ncbi:hypothetical protein F5876DRAFT_68728 [Lentinula aff. lateritia]|uniref:Uncharacterized protein n=1 Tax=Lentinula aff. lateritia TaxID=2804960 RepID=A0ACC1TPZ7_9AGAR|nr:hypothetical protein F5876DRAFT_68728 [Lentinula aff. lateritia]